MTIYKGKLHQERYFEPDDYAGQLWDLSLVFRVANEDEQELNGRINDMNDELKAQPKSEAWFVTLGLLPKQIANIPENWQVIYHPKTYLMLYDTAFKGSKTMETLPRAGVWNPVDFVWVSAKEVWTVLSGDNLNYRFRQLNSVEVAKVLASNPPPVEPPTEEPGGEEPEEPGTGTATNLTIHIKCPHCGKKIF